MQLSLFGGTTPFKIDKPIRLIELFGGISCQAQALLNLGVDFENYRYCDFDKYACQSHNEIMGTNDKPSDITKWKGEDLGICDTDKYCYIMTYSYPCTDLSTAGKMAGMAKGSGTRSGLIWEVERLLKECNELPQVLLMENVPQVHGKKNKTSFDEWCQFLESLGYKNYWKDLNAKDYGVPQSRNRCFMVSLLGDYSYEFPEPIELKIKLQDLLEDDVDEKYYISDKMVKYISANNEKWFGNNGNNSCINRECACTKTTRERQTRADTSDYICNDLPVNYKLKQVAQITDKGFTEMTGRVYDSNGLSPTIQTMQGGNRQPKIMIEKIDIPQIVKVRKHDVNIKKLKQTLKNHKNLNIKEIAKQLNKPITTVEHWFRTDDCFSIPDADIWFELKKLLRIKTDEFDLPITEFEEREGVFEKSNGYYFDTGLSPTLTSSSADEKIICTKLLVGVGEKRSNNGTQYFMQDRIYEGDIANAVCTCANPYYKLKDTFLFSKRDGLTKKIDVGTAICARDYKGFCNQAMNSVVENVYKDYRIRKLTPTECLRLQGVRDEYSKRITCSSTQRYKQAGNGIVVNVLMAIFKQML